MGKSVKGANLPRMAASKCFWASCDLSSAISHLLTQTTRPFLVFLNEGEDVGVLSLDAAGGVNHQDTHIGRLDCADGAYHRVIFYILGDFLLLAYSGGVDQVEVEAELVVASVDGVACGAGDVGHDVAVLADEGVDER